MARLASLFLLAASCASPAPETVALPVEPPAEFAATGDRVLPFRSSLLQAPVAQGIDCVPVALHYTLPEYPDRDTTKVVAWHDHSPLHRHMWQLACSGRIDVEVRILPPRRSEDRKQLARDLESDVRRALESMRGGSADAPAPAAPAADTTPVG